MARIPYASTDGAGAAATALPDLNIFRMLAHAQTAAEPCLRFAAALLSELQIDPGLRELAILQVAKETEARYEWIQHVAIGRLVGLSEAQIAAVESGALDDASLSPAQRAVLSFTAEVVRTPRASDAVFAAVAAHLSSREIVELLLTIGNYTMLARVMTTLDLELDEPVGESTVAAAQRAREGEGPPD